jgi:outer membrane protein assembly factor BamB
VNTTVQIFLSYAREDEEKVDQLYQQLSAAGFKPWMDKRDILPGERWKSSIPRAIRQSDFFMACLSKKSVSKRGLLQREIRGALDIWQEKLEDDIYLIPVRLEDCPVPESLCDFQWVDLFEEQGWTRLVRAIQVGMERRVETIRPAVQEPPPSESDSFQEKPSSDAGIAIPPSDTSWLEAPSPTVLWLAQLDQTPAEPLLAISDLLLVPTQEPSPSSQHSTLHALSLTDGSPLWQRPFEYALVSGLAAVQTSEVSETSEVLALVATSSTDLLRSEGALLALDAAGEQRWLWSAGAQRVSAPAVARGVACVTADARTLFALDPATGAERARVGLEASASLSAPALVGDVTYIPCRGPHLLAVGLDGRSRWRFDAKGSPDAWLDKTPVVVEERLFAVLSTGAVLGVRTEDGSLAWRMEVGAAGKRLSPPATDGERLYVGARDGLHALALADGHELWAFPTERRIEATPVVMGGVVYATCYDHHLYALDAATGRELWRHQVERRIEVPPVVAPCGEPTTPCILVADRGGTLTAVARPPSAEEHEAGGHWIEAASAYAALGQSARGAELLETHGEPFKAAELWKAAGELERAAGQYEAAGAWQQAAELWSALGRPLKQAEALEQHARSLEGGPCSDEERAAAWTAAAGAFETEGEMERAVPCRREVARCLRQPVITLDVEHEGLVLDAWSRLRFIVRNEGYGPARNLAIRARGDQFEGQVTATRRIATLRAGQERTDWLDVRPRAYGDSVPLRVSVEYEDQAGESCTCEHTIYIAVARSEAARRPGQTINVFVSGSGAVAVGEGAVAAGAEGVAVSGDVRGDVTVGAKVLADAGSEMAVGAGEPMATPQILPSAERPAPAISVSPAIRQLATLMRARREADDQPYILLLGSSLSLTTEVRQAVCGSHDWEAFWTAMERLSAAERRALLAGPFDSLNLTAGYRYLAQPVQAGYFGLILTLNVDDALDESLRILSAREYQILTHGQVSGTEIAAALGRTHPRVKVVKLRGDINAYKLPLTPEGQFEFPERLEKEMERLLSQDTILVGDIPYDTDIQRCIRQGEGALWVVVPEEPRPGGFLYNAKKARPKGEIITGTEAEFVPFFSALARELGVESSEVSDTKPSTPMAFEFTFDLNDFKFSSWFPVLERLIPVLPDEIRAKEALYAEAYLDYPPDRSHVRSNKTKWLDKFLQPIVDGEATGGYIALHNLSKDGKLYDHLKVTIDTQSGELKIEITDSTRSERRQALASRIVEEMGKLKGVRRVMPSS